MSSALNQSLPTYGGSALERTTIIEVPFEPACHTVGSLALSDLDAQDSLDVAVQRKTFNIRLANNQGHRNKAGLLMRKMYSWRGYAVPIENGDRPNRITLIAAEDDHTVGTLTLGFDSPIGLSIDQLYKIEIEPMRRQGRKLCEFTRLAVDRTIRSKQVLAALFHIAYIYARNILNHTDLFIEVNPRHVKFYERMLGFKQCGEERLNPRVNAPGVLLSLELEYVHRRLQEFGGKAELAGVEKSLYPYGFSPQEEGGITQRIRRLNIF